LDRVLGPFGARPDNVMHLPISDFSDNCDTQRPPARLLPIIRTVESNSDPEGRPALPASYFGRVRCKRPKVYVACPAENCDPMHTPPRLLPTLRTVDSNSVPEGRPAFSASFFGQVKCKEPKVRASHASEAYPQPTPAGSALPVYDHAPPPPFAASTSAVKTALTHAPVHYLM
jgi:hypothetical protein